MTEDELVEWCFGICEGGLGMEKEQWLENWRGQCPTRAVGPKEKEEEGMLVYIHV